MNLKLKLKKATVSDVLMFITVVLVFVVITINTLQFSSTATIDTYVKNIVNTETTRMASNLAGFSKESGSLNMYNSNGIKRSLGYPNEAAASSLTDETASAYAILNKVKLNADASIRKAFEENPTLNSKTENIKIYFELKDRTRKSTLITVTVTYDIVVDDVEGKEGGLFAKESEIIPRKAVSVRTIENPFRFKL